MKSGFLLIDKDKDWTSFDVVKKIRNITQIKKVGHIGTLDPFATGLLILLFNQATSFSQYIIDNDKEYLVKSQFDIMTETGDITGKIINTENSPTPITKKQFEKKINLIKNISSQTPPKYSAIKVNGEKAYKMAYKGKDIVLPERNFKIISFEFLGIDYPYFIWKAKVSKGTYIRTLTEQIAELFGKIATTVELRRLKIGSFDVSNSIKINQIDTDIKLLQPDLLLDDFEKITLNIDEERKFIHGQNFTIFHHDTAKLRVYNHKNDFKGLATINNNILHAIRVLND
ncbi:MAG: tRNA pseudouridine(55) synthase TruB [Candidatus Cloacimonetes bacterium]|nr:tRNA pseudouridine(55) synthase TruB [Candidatus Cloacimonadota bacterium]